MHMNINRHIKNNIPEIGTSSIRIKTNRLFFVSSHFVWIILTTMFISFFSFFVWIYLELCSRYQIVTSYLRYQELSKWFLLFYFLIASTRVVTFVFLKCFSYFLVTIPSASMNSWMTLVVTLHIHLISWLNFSIFQLFLSPCRRHLHL